jgi:positive regulator of sigma E activity
MMKAFRVLGLIGAVLIGVALAIAPVAAFEDRMTVVSALGIAGIAFLLLAWLARRFAPPAPREPDG